MAIIIGLLGCVGSIEDHCPARMFKIELKSSRNVRVTQQDDLPLSHAVRGLVKGKPDAFEKPISENSAPGSIILDDVCGGWSCQRRPVICWRWFENWPVSETCVYMGLGQCLEGRSPRRCLDTLVDQYYIIRHNTVSRQLQGSPALPRV